ncbi:hypothetical protein MMC13_000891 [Lambiella insularis]|nr:hypothetical protein [Lambiella insularis]
MDHADLPTNPARAHVLKDGSDLTPMLDAEVEIVRLRSEVRRLYRQYCKVLREQVSSSLDNLDLMEELRQQGKVVRKLQERHEKDSERIQRLEAEIAKLQKTKEDLFFAKEAGDRRMSALWTRAAANEAHVLREAPPPSTHSRREGHITNLEADNTRDQEDKARAAATEAFYLRMIPPSIPPSQQGFVTPLEARNTGERETMAEILAEPSLSDTSREAPVEDKKEKGLVKATSAKIKRGWRRLMGGV